MRIQTAAPVTNIICSCILRSTAEPKELSIADIRVSTDTAAAAKLTALQAESIGLLYFLYLIMFIVDTVNAINVYIAIATVVIGRCSKVLPK